MKFVPQVIDPPILQEFVGPVIDSPIRVFPRLAGPCSPFDHPCITNDRFITTALAPSMGTVGPCPTTVGPCTILVRPCTTSVRPFTTTVEPSTTIVSCPDNLPQELPARVSIPLSIGFADRGGFRLQRRAAHHPHPSPFRLPTRAPSVSREREQSLVPAFRAGTVDVAGQIVAAALAVPGRVSPPTAIPLPDVAMP